MARPPAPARGNASPAAFDCKNFLRESIHHLHWRRNCAETIIMNGRKVKSKIIRRYVRTQTMGATRAPHHGGRMFGNEREFVRWLRREATGRAPGVRQGIGDDAALVEMRRGYELILTTDL